MYLHRPDSQLGGFPLRRVGTLFYCNILAVRDTPWLWSEQASRLGNPFRPFLNLLTHPQGAFAAIR